MGLRKLQSYSQLLTQTADSLAISIDQTFFSSSPCPALQEAVDLISSSSQFNIPSLLLNEFKTVGTLSEEESIFWIRRLDNIIRMQAVSFTLPSNARIVRIQDCVLQAEFEHEAIAKLTLVPLFESSDYAWHILSLDLGDEVSTAIQMTLLVQIQARHNRKTVSESHGLLVTLSDELHRFHQLHVFNKLVAAFENMRRFKRPHIELLMKDRYSLIVKPWHDGPSFTCSFRTSDAALILEVNGDIKLIETADLDVFSSFTLDNFVNRISLEKLTALRNTLIPEMSRSLALFDKNQFTIGQLCGLSLNLQMPLGEIICSINSNSGKYTARHTHLEADLNSSLNESRPDAFVKAVRQIRLRQLGSLMAEKLAGSPDLLLIDASTVALSRLSINHLVFVLKHFYGKLLAVELQDSPKIFYAWEDSASGRCQVQELVCQPSFISINDPNTLAQTLQFTARNILAKVLEQECRSFGLQSTPVDQNTTSILNIGMAPNVYCVSLIITSPQHAAFKINYKLESFNSLYVQSSMSGTSLLVSETGRFRFDRLLRRLRGFMALLLASKQLELKQIHHNLECDRLDLSHPKVGSISVVLDLSADFATAELPLTIVLVDSSRLTHEQLNALQTHVRTSGNILVAVEFINRALSMYR